MGLIRPLAWSLALTVVMLLCGGAARPAYAAFFTVNTTADEFGAGADCSLREAIQSANTDAAFGGCTAGSGTDTIELPAGTYTVTLPGLEDLNASGDFDISSTLTIERSGAGTVTVNGGAIDRVFEVRPASNLTLNDIHVTGGNAQGQPTGGGIFVNSGGFTMQGGSITGNSNAIFGGALFLLTVSDPVMIDGVLISGNSASVVSGALHTALATNVTIRNSLIEGNSAPNVGALVSENGSVVALENVTISGNRAPHVGGVNVNLGGTLSLVNVTMVDNGFAGGDSGNLFTDATTVINVRNSILADPFGGTNNCTVLGTGVITSQGSNLSDDTSCAAVFNQPGDQNNVEPVLGPLQNNGGPTETYALLPGSPAIDGVVGACALTTDQRGITRPKDGNSDGVARCDIGAFEAPAVGRIQLSSATFTVPENPAAATITVIRINGAEGAASATVAFADGTATAPADYTPGVGLVQFADGESGSKSVPFPVINDVLDEPDETVNLTLTLATGASVIGTPDTAVLTITDDDATPGLSINDVSVTEGNSGSTSATFTVTLAAPSAQVVTVQAQTADGTAQAGSDYTATGPTTLTFPPGTTSQPFTVPILGDTLPETTETFVVNLSAPVNTSIGDGQGTGTIVNDEALPTLSIGNLTIPEGNTGTTPVTFTVTLSPASALPVTVQVRTEDGTGLAGADYTAFGPATLTFAPGVTTQTFAVHVLGDDIFEDDETFEVRLTGATNATIGTIKGAALITNDDSFVEQVKPDDDDDDRKKETEEQRQQRQNTNRGNKDDVYTEGNVTEVHLDAVPPYVMVGNRDGDVKVVLLCGDQCPTIRVGDYLEADGEKQHEQLFEATDVTVKRGGR